MRRNRIMTFIRGYVTLVLTGKGISYLINEMQKADLHIWDIAWQKNGHAVCCIAVRDVKIFRHVARTAGVRFRIIQRHGFPFILARLETRKFFVSGFIVFILCLIIASNLIWDVDVEGNETIPEKEILKLAREAGVYEGQFQFRLDDFDTIQRALRLGLSDASWIGLRVQGTRAIITVVEKRRIDAEERQKKDGPYDLVASRSALITDLSGVKTGRVLVDYNDTVAKGERLVSGVYGDPQADGTQEITGAQGSVMGETWYSSLVTVPLSQSRKVYTGEKDISRFPYIGPWVLTFPWLDDNPFSNYETVEHKRTFQFIRWNMPFGYVKRERLETKQVSEERSKAEAEELALERAEQDVLSRIGPKGKIMSSKVLQKEVKDGKVILKILFTVREDIADYKPILLEEKSDDST